MMTLRHTIPSPPTIFPQKCTLPSTMLFFQMHSPGSEVFTNKKLVYKKYFVHFSHVQLHSYILWEMEIYFNSKVHDTILPRYSMDDDQ